MLIDISPKGELLSDATRRSDIVNINQNGSLHSSLFRFLSGKRELPNSRFRLKSLHTSLAVLSSNFGPRLIIKDDKSERHSKRVRNEAGGNFARGFDARKTFVSRPPATNEVFENKRHELQWYRPILKHQLKVLSHLSDCT